MCIGLPLLKGNQSITPYPTPAHTSNPWTHSSGHNTRIEDPNNALRHLLTLNGGKEIRITPYKARLSSQLYLPPSILLFLPVFLPSSPLLLPTSFLSSQTLINYFLICPIPFFLSVPGISILSLFASSFFRLFSTAIPSPLFLFLLVSDDSSPCSCPFFVYYFPFFPTHSFSSLTLPLYLY